MTVEKMDEPVEQTGDDRGISVARDASGNAFVTGDNNSVKVIIYQTVSQQRQPEEPRSTEIGPNPYMGLLAFHEEDADRFFGREKQIARLWEKLRDLHQQSSQRSATPRLLPILGPSGSGKSSVARAGLIPELARRPLPGWRDARVAVLTPGTHPLEALAGVLARMATGDAVPVAKTREFKEELKLRDDAGHYDGLRRIADSLPEIASAPLIVLVDQFEEIYSLCDDKQERTVFIENLLHAVSDASGRASVVITLRTDFLGETQTHEVLNRLICEQQVMIPALSEEELRAVIAKPAALAGHPLDDATITLLVNDAKDREGALPLLQFALTRIWKGLTQGIEPAITYQKIGGVGGALAGEAQRIYDALADDQKRIAKRVFLGLVQLGEGTRDTRRRAVVSELVSVGEDASEVDQVIRRFSGRDARLVTLSADERGTADTAEVTHEALFTHWEQLHEWLAENRDDIRFSRRLTEAARTWDQQGRPDGGLWQPPNLELLRQFYGRMSSDMNSLQMDFYVASDQGEKARIAKERRQQLVLRSLLAVAATTSLLSIAMLVWALLSRGAAIRTEQSAQSGRIDALTDAIRLSPPATAGETIKSLIKATSSHSLREYAVQKLKSELDKPVPASASRDEQVSLASGKANLAVALSDLGVVERILPLLKRGNDPTLRSYLIHRFSEADVDAELVAAQLEREEDPSIRQALILSLGEFAESKLGDQRDRLIPKLIKWYRTDPDPGVHAGSEWLLRQWNQDVQKAAHGLREDDEQFEARKSDDKRRWYVNNQGQTMIMVPGQVEFQMGSPGTDEGGSDAENIIEMKIDHNFAIADKEITNDEFRRFLQDKKYRDALGLTQEDAVDLIPADAVATAPVSESSWYMAAAYCNWLTEQEMGSAAAQDQLCYVPADAGDGQAKFANGMTIHPEFSQRTGYRLPTEAEWEYACRAMTKTRWSHGEAEGLLGKYARYNTGSAIQVGRLKPNDFGLFDMHGNAWEWCQEVHHVAYTTDVAVEELTVNDQDSRVLRGGSFFGDALVVRSAYRFNLYPVDRIHDIGFRVARTYN